MNDTPTGAVSSIKLRQVKQHVDRLLDTFFTSQLEDARRLDESYYDLWHSLYLLFSSKTGGKRLRPYITTLAYEAFGGAQPTSILPAAAAQELLHLAVLVHDDIIDRADKRYGIANVSGNYFKAYAPFVNDTRRRRHFADSAAIMAGDLLLSSAYLLIQQSKVDPLLILQAQRTLGTAIFNVVGGNLLDTEAPIRPTGSIDAGKIGRFKTASYSFVSPLVMGAQLAGATPDTLGVLRAFGLELGMAFQIRDDILGVFGKEAETGKSVSSDILEGKHTYLTEWFYAHAEADAQAEFKHLFGREDLTNIEIERVRQLFDESGAYYKAEEAVGLHASAAQSLLETLGLESIYNEHFHELVTLCTDRVK